MATDDAEPRSKKLLDHVFRRHYSRLVAQLPRVFGTAHLDLVEDVVQEAMLGAVRTWPFRGIPDSPEAWISRVARNAALDAIRSRRDLDGGDDLDAWATEEDPPPVDSVADDDLRMIFTCCHPALTPESRVALTLKTLGGFGVDEIASALLAKRSTVAQRISRAKEQLRQHQVPFEVPAVGQLRPRLHTVLEVTYLMFNEGYRAHRGEALTRAELIHESIRLTELLLEMPETDLPRVHAQLALMHFQGSRLPARLTAAGDPLTLAIQDRGQWDQNWIQRGFHYFRSSFPAETLTPVHIEASIASLHAMAPTYAETDWAAILNRYDQLVTVQDTPVVRLNRAVAIAKVHGVDAGIDALNELGSPKELASYHLLAVTRATLLWARGEHEAATACWRTALSAPCATPERQFLESRLAACQRGESVPDW